MSHPQRFQRLPLAVALGTLLPLASTSVHAQLEEVVVTATKQSESLQDVPISVSALSGDSMREQGIMTFDEYVSFLPNVVDAGNSPGMREIYIRGSATEQASVTVSSAQGSAPGVALYLDETPVSFGGRNLDVYAADIERIEGEAQRFGAGSTLPRSDDAQPAGGSSSREEERKHDFPGPTSVQSCTRPGSTNEQ